MATWVGYVALCSGTVGERETVSLLGIRVVNTGFRGWRLTGDSWKIKKAYKVNVNIEKILMTDQLKNMTVFILIEP